MADHRFMDNGMANAMNDVICALLILSPLLCLLVVIVEWK